MNRTESLNKIEHWFIDRNLHTLDGRGQLEKLEEEINELANAKTREEEIDAVGDIVVVLVGYCLQRKIEKYNELIILDKIEFKGNYINYSNMLFDLLNLKYDLKQRFKNDVPEFEKVVVKDIVELLYVYCVYKKLSFWQCVESAYNEIKDRKGKVIDGVFVKEKN